ncbi:antitoxin MazE family protein [Endozoicomonas arenosclerae]|uniref:antitoxin MazE family protein n=1 Tax=Endozoicomonas arenosclerae TaxID=1633495 RepID=UPI000782642D|nr:antitoxin MazE family protein [Endozoicomonas arenosclerae]
MIRENQSSNARQRVKRHRDALREAGFRPVQIGVPDTRLEGFAQECRKQSALLKNDQAETDTLDWIEQLSDDEGWE